MKNQWIRRKKRIDIESVSIKIPVVIQPDSKNKELESNNTNKDLSDLKSDKKSV